MLGAINHPSLLDDDDEKFARLELSDSRLRTLHRIVVELLAGGVDSADEMRKKLTDQEFDGLLDE